MKTTGMIAIGLVVGGVYLAYAQPAGTTGAAVPRKDEAKPAVQAAPADTNALAALEQEERDLLATSKGLTGRIVAAMRPVQMARQRVLADDPELAAIVREIAAKQKELEQRLEKNHPTVAAMSRENDDLKRQFSEVGEKLRDVRKKMDAIRTATAAQGEGKKETK